MKLLSLLIAKSAVAIALATVPSLGETPPEGFAYEFEWNGAEYVYSQTIPVDEVQPPTLEEGNEFCDSCGEQYPVEELAELDYGEWHGPICDICRDFWSV